MMTTSDDVNDDSNSDANDANDKDGSNGDNNDGEVERYGGDITAANRPAAEGSGAVLQVLLLSEPEADAPAG